MNWQDFEAAERHILARAPEARWRLFEVRLRLARERLASGANVAVELAAMERDVASPATRRSERPHPADA